MDGLHSSPPAPPPSRNLPVTGLLVGAAVALLALVAGGGYLVYSMAFQRANAIPQLLAADTALYVAFTPNLSDVPNLDRIRRAFPAENGTSDDSFEQQLQNEFGVSFQTDIAPWVGGEAAFAVADLRLDGLPNPLAEGDRELPASATALVVVASRDDRAAQSFLDKQRAHREGQGQRFTSSTVDGVTIYSQEGGEDSPLTAFAVARRHVVFASSPDLIADLIRRDADGAETLERNPRFQQVRAALPESRIGYLYMGNGPLVQAVEAADAEGVPAALREEQLQTMRALNGIGMAMGANQAGFAFDVVASMDRAALPARTLAQIEEYSAPIDGERVAAVSDRALAAASFLIPKSFGESLMESFTSVPELNEQLAGIEEQIGINLERDLFSWFHGHATFVLLPGETVMGSELPMTGYFALRSADKAAAEQGMDNLLGALLGPDGAAMLQEERLGDADWKVVGPPGEPIAGYSFVGDELVIGFGKGAMAAAAGADGQLATDGTYQQAIEPLPTPNNGVLYVALGPILDLAAQNGAEQEQIDRLRPFRSLSAAATPGLDEAGVSRSRIFVAIEPTP